MADNAVPDCRLLSLHGGGYVICGPGTHRDLAGRISKAAGVSVLVIDYRLAPEHPYPAAVEDATAALRWMHDNGPGGPASASARRRGPGAVVGVVERKQDAKSRWLQRIGVVLPPASWLYRTSRIVNGVPW